MGKKAEKRIVHKITEEYAITYGLNTEYVGKDIVVYNTRDEHLKKHKDEFSDIESFNIAYLKLDEIVRNPDFISTGNDNDSLLFVKQLHENSLVVAKITKSGDFKIRSLYPINNNKKDKLRDSSLSEKPNIGKKTTTK